MGGGGGVIVSGAASSGPVTIDGMSKEMMDEQVSLLRRIEERLAENFRVQDKVLQTEFEQMNRTRGEMTRCSTSTASLLPCSVLNCNASVASWESRMP